VFEVRDGMCPWNDARWKLDAGPEGAALARTNETPTLTMDVSTLAQLVFGQISLSRAVRYGRAEATPATDLTMYDNIFRTNYAPFCPDGF
jgi:hypothetical protein